MHGSVRDAPALLALGTPARGTKVRRQQVAHVRNPWGIAALRYLVRRAAGSGSLLLGCSYAAYRAAFEQAGHATGLTAVGLRFTPHCPRAGAATQGRLAGRSVQELMLDGRWASELSLRTYLDTAMAMATRTMHAAVPFRSLERAPSRVGPVFAF